MARGAPTDDWGTLFTLFLCFPLFLSYHKKRTTKDKRPKTKNERHAVMTGETASQRNGQDGRRGQADGDETGSMTTPTGGVQSASVGDDDDEWRR